jgi:pimeloyl-ACP methyl ester carboxylesterase
MFHSCGIDKEDASERTVAVVTGWMGSKTSQLKPYIKYYNDKGIDTVSLAVGPAHILFPNKAQVQMEQVMAEVLKRSPGKVIIHQFSMGGYLYSQLLRVMAKNPDSYKPFGDKICAQIFDSPPDVHGIAYGISRGFKPAFVQDIVKVVLDLALKLMENGAGAEHRAASKQMHENYITAPSLWFYSHADVIAPAKDCEVVIKRWRENDIDVEACVFENTKHIQHGRAEPERYFGALDSFLKNK